jgi:hypothetical protein
MSLGIVPGQSAIQINADPMVLGDENRFGARIQSDSGAQLAVLVGCFLNLQWAHEYTLNSGHLKSTTMLCRNPKRL